MTPGAVLAREGGAPGWPLVLYFHHVSPDIRHYTALSPSAFRRGLELCLKHFGPALHPDQLETALTDPPDHPTFLVTFDDGYADVLEHAAPIMADLDIAAVHFLISDAVETGGCTGIPAPRAPFLDRDGIAELAAAGHRLAAHSRSHARFDRLTATEFADETGPSAFTHSSDSAGPIRLFAYPYGALPPVGMALPPDVLAFATVSSPALCWTTAPRAIRRTFLPSDDLNCWSNLIGNWSSAWHP